MNTYLELKHLSNLDNVFITYGIIKFYYWLIKNYSELKHISHIED